MKVVNKTSDKYSKTKIVWFPEKLQSFVSGKITSPLYVRVKPLNRCNHKCFWCVYHEPELADMHYGMNKFDKIPTEKMLEVLDDFKEMGIKAVTYSGGGEPLMHEGIIDILKRTKEHGIDLSVITNGHYLKGEIAELFSDAHWVRISIDYYDEESFVVGRRIKGKNYNKVIENIENFAKIKSPECDLSVNFIITKENYKGIRKAAKLLISLGVENIRFSPMWIDNFNEYHADIKEEVIGELIAIKRDLETDRFKLFSSYKYDVFKDDIKVRHYDRCFVKEFNPVLGADLNIYACHNQAYDEDSIIASCKDRSFKEAWFSDEAKVFHRVFDCRKTCTGQCASDDKNLFIHELLNCEGDNFV
jgi:MoaA/NifB/PqqE/SkfB family radical SAM enzyme